MANTQPIEKRVNRSDGYLDVHSIFYTIQGEGPFCGTPAVFIRLAGCNLQCPGCDTQYTQGRRYMSPNAVLYEVIALLSNAKRQTRLVVITGGEPFRQNLSHLFYSLILSGYYIQVETNGTLPPTEWRYELDYSRRDGVYAVCSPKSGKVNPRIWEIACCAKYVMSYGDMREEDGLPITALRHTANPYVARPPERWNRPIYLQPMDEKNTVDNDRNISAVLESCMKHGYIMQLQIHKIIGLD